MKLMATIALTVLVAGSAYAGGNPEDDVLVPGVGEAVDATTILNEAAPLPAPVSDQHELQRSIEAEIRNGWEKMNDSVPKDNDLVAAEQAASPTIIRVAEVERDSDLGDCTAFFGWLEDLIGEECEQDYANHNPSPISTVTMATSETVTKDKSFKTRTRKHAKRAERFWNSSYGDKIAQHKGYDEASATRKGQRVTVTFSKTVVTLTQVRGDSDGSDTNEGRNSAADSNHGDGGGGSGNRRY